MFLHITSVASPSFAHTICVFVFYTEYLIYAKRFCLLKVKFRNEAQEKGISWISGHVLGNCREVNIFHLLTMRSWYSLRTPGVPGPSLG